MPRTATIRPATRADLPAVDALLAASYPRLLAADYPPSVLVTALPRIARARPELLASGSYYLAHEGEMLVAAGGWTHRAPTGEGRRRGVGHVRHVVAHPDHLRRGHARRLVEHAIAEARAAGLHALGCLSTRTAVPFYAALGFRVTGPVDVPLAPGITFPSVGMARTL